MAAARRALAHALELGRNLAQKGRSAWVESGAVSGLLYTVDGYQQLTSCRRVLSAGFKARREQNPDLPPPFASLAQRAALRPSVGKIAPSRRSHRGRVRHGGAAGLGRVRIPRESEFMRRPDR